MPTKVVFIDHVARMSGGEIALLRLLAAVSGRVEAHVILGEEGPLVAEIRALGVACEVLPMAEALRDVRKDAVAPSRLDPRPLLSLGSYVLRLRRRLRDLGPDIVHTNSLKAALYGGVAGRLAGVPVLWHVRDRIAADYLPRPAVALVRAASRVLPTAVVANSASTLSTLPGRRRATVLYNPVVLDAASASRGPRTDRPLRIGVVGRLAPWKGQHVFLAAFARAFPAGDVEARLIGSALFGEDAFERELHAQVERLGIASRVQFRGYRDDIPRELAELDVLVHCSTTPEPFGQVVVEGMAAGLPVIAADAGGPTEIITDGVDGLLTPPGDVEALAEALLQLADDPGLRQTLGDAGRQSARRFSPVAASERLMAVYAAMARR